MLNDAFATDGQDRRYYDSGGDRPVLLLLPAHSIKQQDLRAAIRRHSAAWRVLALAPRFDLSVAHDIAAANKAYARDVAALLAHLDIDTPVSILGRSRGGTSAYLFAAAPPHCVHDLVLGRVEALVRKRVKTQRVSRGAAWAPRFESREFLTSATAMNGPPWGERLVNP